MFVARQSAARSVTLLDRDACHARSPTRARAPLRDAVYVANSTDELSPRPRSTYPGLRRAMRQSPAGSDGLRTHILTEDRSRFNGAGDGTRRANEANLFRGGGCAAPTRSSGRQVCRAFPTWPWRRRSLTSLLRPRPGRAGSRPERRIPPRNSAESHSGRRWTAAPE
jgi:hypothetical protein